MKNTVGNPIKFLASDLFIVKTKNLATASVLILFTETKCAHHVLYNVEPKLFQTFASLPVN